MKIYNSTDIKLGILKDLKKQVVRENYSSKLFGLNGCTITTGRYGRERGIIFEETDDLCHDCLYPELYYPFIKDENYEERTNVVGTDFEPLTPLLDYFNMRTFTTPELEEFVKDILARKQWLKENEELFGLQTKKYGPIWVRYDIEEGPLPSSLYEMINTIQSDSGFGLTKREQKRLGRK